MKKLRILDMFNYVYMQFVISNTSSILKFLLDLYRIFISQETQLYFQVLDLILMFCLFIKWISKIELKCSDIRVFCLNKGGNMTGENVFHLIDILNFLIWKE